MALGKNLAHLRKLIGSPSLKAVSDALKVGAENHQWLHQLETRDSKHSQHARALAVYFGVDYDILTTQDLTGFSSIEEIRALTAKTLGKIDNEKLMLNAMYDLMSPQAQRLLIIRATELVKFDRNPVGAIETALDSLPQPEPELPKTVGQDKAPPKSKEGK